jgi:hypothetical protein
MTPDPASTHDSTSAEDTSTARTAGPTSDSTRTAAGSATRGTGPESFLAWQARQPHRAAPGPGYWDWRCLICSGPVDNRDLHPRFGRLKQALRRWWLDRPAPPAHAAAEAPTQEEPS